MSEELIPINIAIGDRTYRIKIKKDDEEQVRKTLKIINDQIVEYKTSFTGKDMQDYIAMVAIWFATQNQTVSGNAMEMDEIRASLQAIDKSIS
jgi:cell division protein ZapA (FtsZ GTPase activity inhibitor)